MTRDRHPSVKGGLTPGRRRMVVENDEYGAFARRVVRSYGRRIATGDVEALGDLIELSDEVNRSIGAAVTGLRAAGYSWGEIASRLGVTRQAVQQRWGGETR